MTTLLTPEETQCIERGDHLYIEKLSVHGVYQDGTPFVREYPMEVFMHQADRIRLNYLISYPDPLAEALNGTLQ